ncbi:MAG: hypothetical protein R3F59_19610 [Myxococcota bacterium]
MLLLTALACARYDSVDDACRDLPGASGAPAEAAEVIGRIDCYRRFAGADGARIVPDVQEAAEAHAAWLARHGTPHGADWRAEAPDTRGFTGADALERLYTSGYLVRDVGTAFVWELLLPLGGGYTRPELVDAHLADPFLRDLFLAPGWEAAGYAEGVDPGGARFGYLEVVTTFPSGTHSLRPVVYPADGQTGVPPAWRVQDPGDPALADLPDVAGFPVSFTFGSNTFGSGSDNPLEVDVLRSELRGPGGLVPHRIVLPGADAAGRNRATAALVPEAPLQPDAEYTWEVALSWVDVGARVLTGSFRTGAAAHP